MGSGLSRPAGQSPNEAWPLAMQDVNSRSRTRTGICRLRLCGSVQRLHRRPGHHTRKLRQLRLPPPLPLHHVRRKRRRTGRLLRRGQRRLQFLLCGERCFFLLLVHPVGMKQLEALCPLISIFFRCTGIRKEGPTLPISQMRFDAISLESCAGSTDHQFSVWQSKECKRTQVCRAPDARSLRPNVVSMDPFIAAVRA